MTVTEMDSRRGAVQLQRFRINTITSGDFP